MSAVSHRQEMALFRQLAAAIGDSLEDVCNMQEKERQELITVLGLVGIEEEENEEYFDSYLFDSDGSGGRQYRTRTVARREENIKKVEISVNKDLLSDSGLGDDEVEFGGGEKRVLEILGGIISDIVDNTPEDKDYYANVTNMVIEGADKTVNSSGLVVVKQQSDCSNSIRDMVKEEGMVYNTKINPDILPRTKTVNRLSLRKKAINAGPSLGKNDITRLANCYVLLHRIDPRKHFATCSEHNWVIRKLCSGLKLPSSYTPPTSRLFLCRPPLPVQAVLARQDLPLLNGKIPKPKKGQVEKYRESLDKVFENISKVKARGLAHSGTREGVNWIAVQNRKKIRETKVQFPLSGRRTRRSSAACRPGFVTGDWLDNSEDEVEGIQGSRDGKDVDWLLNKDEASKDDSRDQRTYMTNKRVGKRKLFSRNKDYMDDSAGSEREEESPGDETKRRKYSRTRKGLMGTIGNLRKDGSLLDLPSGLPSGKG